MMTHRVHLLCYLRASCISKSQVQVQTHYLILFLLVLLSDHILVVLHDLLVLRS